MTTPPLSPSDTAAYGTSNLFSGADKSLDRDAFLQLLVTQLSNQDPLNPQEGHEFAAQLAQFSSVEQLSNISGTLASHSKLLADLATGMGEAAARQDALAESVGQRSDLASAAGLIGQTVEAKGGYAVWNGSAPPTLGIDLASPAASVRVVVRDASGAAVRTMDVGHLGRGRQTVSWDGLGDDGQPAPPNTYTFTVEAAGPDGDAISAAPYTQGRVDRVTIEPDGIRFWIGPHAVPMGNLISLVS